MGDATFAATSLSNAKIWVGNHAGKDISLAFRPNIKNYGLKYCDGSTLNWSYRLEFSVLK